MAVGTDTCPSCHATITGAAQFCAQCGYQLAGVEYAGFWIRFVASIIDGVIVSVTTAAIVAAVGGGAGIVVSLAIGITYTIGFWLAKGATPGKMIVGVEIVKVGGEPLDFGSAILRYIGLWVSTLTLGIGYLMIAFRRDKRGLHDLIAGTMVVKT